MIFHSKANKRAKKSRRIPFSEFYIEEIGTTPQLLECDVLMWMDIRFGLVKVIFTMYRVEKTRIILMKQGAR